MLFKIPTIIAKITLLSYVTGYRMMIVYGITSVYLSIWALSVLSKSKYINKVYSIFVCILITFFYYISVINSPMKSYVSFKYYIILFIALFILNYLLTQGKKKLFSVIMLIVILIAGATVNPIARGVGAIYNNYLSYKMQEIRKVDPQAYWISANDPAGSFMGTFLYTNGLKTVNGTNFYPDLNKWYKIDEKKKYLDIYNRYEHITVNITNKKTDVKLLYQDSVELNLNVEDLRKLNIKYILTKDDLTKYNEYEHTSFQCVYSKDKDGYYIFKVLYK
uniref:DUF7654 domain-containing protein n=2 Tax=Clostridium arbusti TaxID=1137848 RepID=UPI001110FE1F|nr:hypothetical protein [Clostridium arbusti]